MKRYTIPGAVGYADAPRAVAIGVFDGWHLGHREVIRHVIDVEDAVPTVLTFEQSPTRLPKQMPALRSREGKAQLLERFGVEELWEMDFDRICGLSPEQFVRQVLAETLHARTVCCGENFRFGAGGQGNVGTLRTLCAARGIRVIVAPTVLCDGKPVSSSDIRARLQAGDIQGANRRLGAPFSVTAPVTEGQHLGHRWGFATLNQVWPDGLCMPCAGVYASCVEIDGRVHRAITNIGVRPTVGGHAPVAETHVFDFEDDLYGRTLSVQPVAFVRPERAFPDIAALSRQVHRDMDTVRALFEPTGRVRAVLFDFDDTLQNRPAAFAKYTDYFVQRHFPALPEEEKRARAHEMWVRNADGHGYMRSRPYIPYTPYFESFIREWDWHDAPPMEALLRECDLRFSAQTTLFDDAAETLRELRGRGMLVGCITNGTPRMQHHKLDVSGLRPLLDTAIVSGDEGIDKPETEIFRRAAARLGVACEDCVFVGDHPENDLAGAASAGMRAVYLDAFSLHEAAPAFPTVKTLQELLPLLADIDRG